MRESGWIVTYTGRKFYPLDPSPQDIDILDIAHALSNACRFSGHTREFYSVAQHSYLVAFTAGREHALYGLLHDASEAYLCDISTPVKYSKMYEEYRVAEHWLQTMILNKFGVPNWNRDEMPQEVKDADRIVGVLEGLVLMPDHEGAFWTEGGMLLNADSSDGFVCWSPKKAESKFLEMYDYISSEA